MEIEKSPKIQQMIAAAALAVEFCDDDDGTARDIGDRSLTEEVEDQSEPRRDSNEGGKKKRCRRKRKAGDHHRAHGRWNWDKKKVADTGNTCVENKKRDGRFASGQPMAPNNTNEFLMDDQQLPSTPSQGLASVGVRPNIVVHPHAAAANDPAMPPGAAASPAAVAHNRKSGEDQSFSGVDGESDSSVGGEQGSSDSELADSYLSKDFMKAYETYRLDRLQTMTKDDLVKECLRMESQMENLQSQNARLVKENDHLRRQVGKGPNNNVAERSVPKQR